MEVVRLSDRVALVVADGGVDRAALREWVGTHEPRPFGVAADGGARHIAAIGWLPDVICGDGDSLGDELAAFAQSGVRIERHPTDKDESDLELALGTAIREGYRRIDVFGALAGERPEHSVANELLLAAPFLDELDVVVHHGRSRIRRVGTRRDRGRATLSGRAGDFVSLLALDDPVAGVVTEGLRFALHGEPLALGSTRGLSNELLGRDAAVTTERGRLLVVETPRPTDAAVGTDA
jgi:thiamine pyrophosphokinase